MKVSIITPVFNGEKYIENCICSVKQQKHVDFEHIIVDGGSSDNTIQIVNSYANSYNMRWISEKDCGMYDAICKGFAMATGDVLCWLNADDIFFPWTLLIVNRYFEAGCKWLTGMPAHRNEVGEIYKIDKSPHYVKKWIEKGYYGTILTTIQQESTFWTRDLWDRVETDKFRDFRLAGDWFLWTEFARYEELTTVSTVLAAFTKREGQLSSEKKIYLEETRNFGILEKVGILFLNKLYKSVMTFLEE